MAVLTDHAGLAIRLTDERRAHILEHPEMVGMEEALLRCLSEPDLVTASRVDADVAMYYRFLPTTPVGAKFVVVVVKTTPDDAFLVTAYLTDKVKTGRVLWSRER
jgi:hypothetical protein